MTLDQLKKSFNSEDELYKHWYLVEPGTLSNLLLEMEEGCYTYNAQMLFKKLHYDINFGYRVHIDDARAIKLKIVNAKEVYICFDRAIKSKCDIKSLKVKMALHLKDFHADYIFSDELIPFDDPRLTRGIDSFYIDNFEVILDE